MARILVLALLGLLLYRPNAYADSCKRLSDRDIEKAIVQLDELSLKSLLPRLEALDECDNLKRMKDKLDTRFDDKKTMLMGILLVTTLGRDPSTIDAKDVALASQLAGELMFESEQLAAMEYAAKKLSKVPDNEPLFAFIHGPVPSDAQVAMLGMVEATKAKQVAPGSWAPPGDQPIPLYIGNEAHKMIADYYEAKHPYSQIETNATPIASILHELVESGVGPATNQNATALGSLALRPDIVNLSSQEIYEIKPAGLESQARTAVNVYIAAFASREVTMHPGRTTDPGTVGVVPAPAGHYRFWSPEPGVIVYRYHRGAYVPVPVYQSQSQTNGAKDPASIPVKARRSRAIRASSGGFWDQMSKATGLTGTALTMYVILSEGSRVILVRNLLPVP